MAPVRIVDVSYVPVPASAALPSEPIKLNAMEAQWVVIPLLQHLLLFEGDQLPPFDAVVQSLRSSLVLTLANFAPLAGKLHYLGDTGDVAIILCSSSSSSDDDGGGVKFVVAESDADVRRLIAFDEEHDLQTFERLVPELNLAQLPAPVLAVQATRLEGGGMALGVTMHHGVADGRSLWRFVEAWAAACRGSDDSTTPVPPPTFDRSLVRLPGGVELARSVLRKYAPDLPAAPLNWLIVEEDRKRFIRRTFTVDAQQIQRLKHRIVRLSDDAQGGPGAPALRRPPSSFVAVIALAWTCSVLTRPFADDEDVILFFFADARTRLDPPVDPEYFGACLTLCQARLPARELRRGEGALAAAAAAVQEAIRNVEENPLDGWEFLSLAGKVPADRYVNVSGSSGFRAYEVADFGWGRPRRTEPVRMNQDGQVALVRARDGEGVQVSVAMLQRERMDVFKSEFLKIISDNIAA